MCGSQPSMRTPDDVAALGEALLIDKFYSSEGIVELQTKIPIN